MVVAVVKVVVTTGRIPADCQVQISPMNFYLVKEDLHQTQSAQDVLYKKRQRTLISSVCQQTCTISNNTWKLIMCLALYAFVIQLLRSTFLHYLYENYRKIKCKYFETIYKTENIIFMETVFICCNQ